MSAPQDWNRVAVAGSQFLGVLLVVVTVITQQVELHSWRPTGTKNQVAAQEDQNKDRFARLWEDSLEDILTFQVSPPAASPLPTASPSPVPSVTAGITASPSITSQRSPSESAAVLMSTLPPPSPTPSPAHAAVAEATSPAQTQAKPGRLPPGAAVTYTFLWNIVDARPLPEITERRLRIRYALVSAILADGYLPLRESVLRPLFEPDTGNLPVKDRTPIGRFETFRKPESDGGKSWRYVAVIWIPKQSQSIQLPIDREKLGQIESAICIQDIEEVSDKLIDGDSWFLHHGNSDDLGKFSADAGSVSPPPHIGFLRATVPLHRLPIPPPPEWKSLQKITTDDVLAQSLVDELSLRIPALNDRTKSPRIVVFTESDTTYSRAITEELCEQLQEKNVRLEIYSYLRALDGRPDEPRVPGTGESSKSNETTASLLQRRAISETSFGTSQFDYLRRTALSLKSKRNGPQEKVVAVGVLGSDIYDKMLVLQAVRPALPAAVFFTTDLDALYLERTMEPFTRNLVVASADDLETNEGDDASSSGWKLPPMRDSYQTVLVREVRNILRSTGTDNQTRPASIFEIAAGKRVDLTAARRSSWPLWWLAQGWFNPLIFIPALINAFLVLWAVTTRDKNNSTEGAMKKWAKWCVYSQITLAGTGVLVLFFILTVWNPIFRGLNSLFGEPLSLGISIWPSVMIRLLAFGVAIVLLCLAYRSFWKTVNDEEHRKALAGIQFSQELFKPSTLRWCVVGLSIAYLLISLPLFFIWQPIVPGRGGLALLIEKIVLALGVGLYVVHLIFCLYLHFCALWLLRVVRLHFQSEHGETSGVRIDLSQMLTSLGKLTTVIGKTLLYPLTVLILIILSRLTIFDDWVMTPSLTITFALGAVLLVGASLALWLQGRRLQQVVLDQSSLWPAERNSLKAVNDGVFAEWYNQPIFSAILSVLAVFGSLSIAKPVTELLFSPF